MGFPDLSVYPRLPPSINGLVLFEFCDSYLYFELEITN